MAGERTTLPERLQWVREGYARWIAPASYIYTDRPIGGSVYAVARALTGKGAYWYARQADGEMMPAKIVSDLREAMEQAAAHVKTIPEPASLNY